MIIANFAGRFNFKFPATLKTIFSLFSTMFCPGTNLNCSYPLVFSTVPKQLRQSEWFTFPLQKQDGLKMKMQAVGETEKNIVF